MNLIGLDIGTTTICGVLYSLDENRTVNTLVKDNGFINGPEGEYLQDPEKIYSDMKDLLDELIDNADGPIGGMSLSSQMHGILYTDKEGKAITPFYTWQNQRGHRMEEGKSLDSYLSEKLGYPVYSGYGFVTHYSLHHEGKIPAEAARFCNIGDYVCMRLAGRKLPVTDLTLGASMGIADIRNGGHSVSLKETGLGDDERIPELVSSTEILGEYRGIPVVQPIGDNQASFLGSVKDKKSSLLINYGTAGQISFHRESYADYPGFETRALGNEGYIHAAFSLCGGKSYMVLAKFLKETALLFGAPEDANPLKIMDAMELDFSEGSDGEKQIESLPLFLGQRGVADNYAFFRNITDWNFNPRNMTRALVLGMINELKRFYDPLPEEVRAPISTLVGAGNGIRRNPHLKKAATQSYGMPLSLLDLSEESCLGAVINAGKGTGIFRDYGEGAARIVRYKQA